MPGVGKVVFKGETSGLKNVSRELLNMAEKVKNLKGNLTQADTALLENAKQIGYMNSSAKSASKQLSEMKDVIRDLTVHYNQLTNAEKSSPYGHALKSSISQLTGRVKDLKTGIDSANKGMSETGAISNSLKSVFGGVAGSVLKLGTVAGATTAAFSAVKETFTATAEGALQWQTTIDSVKNAYEGFLISINTGNVGGFLQNIQAIISATETARQSIAGLEKSLTFDSVPLAKAKNEWQDAMDVYRRNKTPGNKKKVDAAAAKVQSLLKSEAASSESTYESAIAATAAKFGITNPASLAAIKNVLSNQGAAGNTGKRYKTSGGFEYYDTTGSGSWTSIKKDKEGKWRYYSEEKNQVMHGGSSISFAIPSTPKWGLDWGNDYQVAMDVAKFNNLIKKDDLAEIQKYGNQAENLRYQASSNRKTNARFTGEYSAPRTAKTSEVKTDLVKIKIEYADGVAALVSPLEASKNKMKALQDAQAGAITPGEAMYYGNRIGEEKAFQSQFMSGEVTPISGNPFLPATLAPGQNLVEPVLTPENKQLDEEERKKRRKGGTATEGAGMALESIGRMGSGIEDLVQIVGGEVPEGLGKTIETIMTLSSIFQSFMMIYQTWEILKKTLLVWIFGAVSTDALIPLAKGGYIPQFAGGGTMGGSSFSGDHLLARLNSGEVVLNSQQSGNILYQLAQSKNGNGGGGSSYVSGEKIFLGVNNYLKRTGKGEIVTTR